MNEETRLLTLMKSLMRGPDHVGPVKRVAIISTQRSGSTFVCDLLSSSGMLPRGEEWFNRSFLRAYAKVTGVQSVDIRHYADWVVRKATGPRGVFFVKLHVNHIAELEEVRFDVFGVGFDAMLSVYRRDKVAQALSLAKARMTGRWRHELEGERPGFKVADIGHDKIARSLVEISLWDDYYHKRVAGRVKGEYCYEDIVAAPDMVVEMFRRLTLEVPEGFVPVSALRRQSDDEDLAKLNEFRMYLGFPGLS